jgi:hypothetical protein
MPRMATLFGWFGESRTEVWRKLSSEIGGTFSEGKWRRKSRVDVVHAHWTITLDIFMVHTGKTNVPFTRLRAPFLNRVAFRCKIHRANVFSAIGKLFGMQDVEVGDEDFDKAFVVKSNDERIVRAFCSSAELRRRLLAQKGLQLSIRDDEGWFGAKFPPDTDELRGTIRGILKDPERLRGLFDLFKTALDQMCAIGAAYESKPSLRL